MISYKLLIFIRLEQMKYEPGQSERVKLVLKLGAKFIQILLGGTSMLK